MTKGRKHFINLNFMRCIVACVMAVILFISSSMSAGAAVHADGDLHFGLAFRNPKLTLDFFGNYIEDGSSRDSSIPYIFRGNTYLYFNLNSTNTNGTLYPYVQGYAFKRITCSLATQTAGLTISSTLPSVSIVDSSLPTGITVYISNLSGNSSEFSFDLCFGFENAMVGRSRRGGVTLSFAVNGIADSHNYGSSYGFVSYIASVSDDYSGLLNFADNVTDFDPGARYFYSNMNSQLNTQQSIYSRLGDINTNISNQGNYIVNKIQNHITNDNSLAQNQIKNDNALAQNQITNDNSIAKNQITNDNNLSKNEIDSAYNNSVREINTANKNADDIMHSYDSGSQESDNKRFDDSQKQLQETEDNLFGSASDYFSGLDMSLFDIAKFTSVVSSLSFVSGLMQSLYTKMGDFGLIVTVGMVIMIASKVIGVYRFSTGDHGKGG